MALAKSTNQRTRDSFKEVGSQTTRAVTIFDSSGDQINLAKESDGNLASIKTNTDNIPSDPSTEAKQDDVITELQVINSLVPDAFDYIALSYTSSNLTEALFKTGGSGGSTVSTLTLAYDESNQLTSVTKT